MGNPPTGPHLPPLPSFPPTHPPPPSSPAVLPESDCCWPPPSDVSPWRTGERAQQGEQAGSDAMPPGPGTKTCIINPRPHHACPNQEHPSEVTLQAIPQRWSEACIRCWLPLFLVLSFLFFFFWNMGHHRLALLHKISRSSSSWQPKLAQLLQALSARINMELHIFTTSFLCLIFCQRWIDLQINKQPQRSLAAHSFSLGFNPCQIDSRGHFPFPFSLFPLLHHWSCSADPTPPPLYWSLSKTLCVYFLLWKEKKSDLSALSKASPSSQARQWKDGGGGGGGSLRSIDVEWGMHEVCCEMK